MNYPESENFETKAIRIQNEKTHSVPIYMTSSFTFEDAEQARALFADEIPGNIYTRFSNPNNSEFVQKVCALEGAEDGIATASGMSAVYTSLAGILKSGDHILVSRSVFGSTHQILTQIFPRFGILFTYADIAKPEEWESLIQKNTRMVFVLIKIIKLNYNLILNVDNCFCTPYVQQPIKYGADLVIHSGTKYMDGQGRVIGGVIVGRKDLIQEIRFFARHTGPSLSPMNAWILSKSLETLAIRMERHSHNALKLAEFLETQSDVAKVVYPFLPSHPQNELAKRQMKLGGGIVSFIVEGGIDRGRRFLNSLEMFSHTANLGDSRTIATHPASTTHSKLTDKERLAVGIAPGLIRISVGLEHISDIILEVKEALKKSN